MPITIILYVFDSMCFIMYLNMYFNYVFDYILYIYIIVFVLLLCNNNVLLL